VCRDSSPAILNVVAAPLLILQLPKITAVLAPESALAKVSRFIGEIALLQML
jgi:hypothetical protein